MSEPNAIAAPETPEQFQDYKKDQNLKEAVARGAAPRIETKKPEDVSRETSKAEPDSPSVHSLKRRLRDAQRDADETRGRLKALEDMGAIPKKEEPKVEAKPEDPEPQLKDFKTEAEYNRALGRWEGRQGAKEVIGKQAETDKSKAEFETFKAELETRAQQSQEDAKLIPDLDDVIKSSEKLAEEGKRVLVDWSKHQTLAVLLAKSSQQAFLLDYFARKDEGDQELRDLLDLTDKPAEQVAAFHQLEGWIKRSYRATVSKKPEEKPEKAKKESAEDAAAKLPRPSSQVGAKGGNAPRVGELSPTLADGHTINPDWKVEMNRKELAHRR